MRWPAPSSAGNNIDLPAPMSAIGGGFHESIVAIMIALSLSKRDFGHHVARSGFSNDFGWYGSIGETDAGRRS